MRWIVSLAVVALFACSTDDGQVAGPPPRFDRIEYTRDVLPILSAHCFACHGPDESARQGGVALHTFLLATTPVADGQPIVPGHPGTSLVMTRVRSTDPTLRMPMGAPALTNQEIGILDQWIALGAHYDSWSLTPPTRPAVPAGAANPVDAFVLDRLARGGVTPSDPAGPATLLRRVTMDLTGLPPTLDEVDAFVADPSDAAYEAVVDRLLASPRHAEHLAHDWLDLAGYGDSNGIYFDEERTSWPWRDWVVDAFDRDVPLDQFVVAQLAGDLLPDATDDDRLATGFLRLHPTTEEGGVIEEEYRIQYAMARTTLVGNALLGLTVQCARCHDHKYDPITQVDFYSLTDCFNHVADLPRTRPQWEPDGQPTSSAPSAIARADLADVRAQLATQRAMLGGLGVPSAQASWEASLPSGSVVWTLPHYAALDSALGTLLTAGSDGRILPSGPSPDVESWELVVDAPQTIRALRITSGAPRQPGQHPFFSEIDAWVESAGARRIVPFEIATTADGMPATEAIDGRTTTAIEITTPTVFLVAPAAPIVLAAGEQLHLRIDSRRGLTSTFGDVLVEVTADPRGTLSTPLAATLGVPVASRGSAEASALTDHFQRVHAPDAIRDVAQRVSRLSARETVLTTTALARVMADDEPTRQTHVLVRGQYDAPADLVSCGVPHRLLANGASAPTTRLAVARWLMSEASPTTARVLANHYVQMLLGRGIVSTPADFGAVGDAPSHPELLDWLAVDLRESGWDLDAFIRRIVTSQTYRQSSIVRPDLLEHDPDNRLFARATRRRWDAEVLHDQALAVSGLLYEHLGGPPVRPYHPEGLYEGVSDHPDAFLITYRPDRAPEALRRRALYTFWRRGNLLPSMALLDAPDRIGPVPRRDLTDTPTQALALIDEPFFVEASRQLAERVRREAGTVDEQITLAFRLCTSRSPSAAELTLLRDAYDAELASATSDPSVLGVLEVGASPRDSAGDPAAHAAMTLVAQAILSSSETVTRE